MLLLLLVSSLCFKNNFFIIKKKKKNAIDVFILEIKLSHDSYVLPNNRDGPLFFTS